MADYVFHLYDGPTVQPRAEVVQAHNDGEARDLASLRLTLSPTFTHVEVEKDGEVLFRLKRDSQEPLPVPGDQGDRPPYGSPPSAN